MTYRTLLLTATIGGLFVAIASCTSDPAPSIVVTPSDAGAATETSTAPRADTGPVSWPASACGSCVIKACTRERALCDAEPSCSAHATCAEACPTSADGKLDSTCIAACPIGEGTAASRARAAYDTCITNRGLQSCDACTKPTVSSLLPILSQTCGASPETNTCFKCEDEKCCNTFQGCVDEPECKQVLQPCIVACGSDNACSAKCYADHPKGVAAWARRQACLLVNCVTQCGATLDPCYECAVMKECRDSTARCNADEGCFLITKCINATCPSVTDACLKTCKAKVPASAAQLFDEFTSCALLSCVGKCG
jgi:hypothetical protein